MAKRLTDKELVALCEQELAGNEGAAGDLAEQRAIALDRYHGEPLGNEVEDRSQVQTREVLDTVEWVMPSLMRIFADAENIAVFEPVGPEDETAARQETEAIKHIFWQQNRGFWLLYTFIKDGLLQKNGVLKVWWEDEEKPRREEYEGLNDWELQQLIDDPAVKYDVLDYAIKDDGTYDLTVMATPVEGRLRIEPCPPEEFGVSKDARSPWPDEQTFSWHRSRKTKAELVEMGFDLDMVKDLPASNNPVDTRERISRYTLSDEQNASDLADHWSLERVWITECYLRVDRDGDGAAELLKITLANQDNSFASGSTMLEAEEVDSQPFVTWTPILRPHAFNGLSIADLVKDIQEIKTTLLRQTLDNMYLANDGRTAVNEAVNLDDFLTSRPGGVVRVAGERAPGEAILPIQHTPVPPQTFQLFEHLDEMRKHRTGVGDEVGALEGNELAKINTGVAALAYDAARAKIELMARLCAELGLRPLFLRMHELLRKRGRKQTSIKLAGQWVPIRPQAWRERTDMTVQVGVGQVSRERRLVALEDVINKQAAAIQAGGMGVFLTPTHVYRALADHAREMGLEESLYWIDPAQVPPRPPQPDYNAAQLQIAQGQVEAQMQANQVEALKVASNERIQIASIQQKEREIELKAQIEGLRADMGQLKLERDKAGEHAKLAIDSEIKARELEIKQAEQRLRDNQESAKREIDLYKALLSSSTTLTQEQMKIANVPVQAVAESSVEQQVDVTKMLTQLAQAVATTHEMLMRSEDERRSPKAVKYGSDGLIESIGGLRLERDKDGYIVSIG